MTKHLLIDANHPEETRVAVIEDGKLLELDYESSIRKQVKGNIYLAKVTRVEPSLQAAFVDYGGNRHGFLPFAEIHPDYFRIPIADRQALIAAEQKAEVETVSEEEQSDDAIVVAAVEGENHVETVALDNDTSDGEDEERIRRLRSQLKRKYKIQEVIKRRQIMLVQVVKEERGNKGAALTTYLSLAGRYCVLMPNSHRGGGVSRKISDAKDRKRIRAILDELNIPQGVSVIVRTAGSERTKVEIKRDYEYLIRLWDEIRAQTLQATAPALIHEEGNLLKRAFRDIYQRDIDEITVAGDDAFKASKAFMKMLMPSHVKKIQQFKEERTPLFQHYKIEQQIQDTFKASTTLKSGGYIVINPTEALVSIDVNSGRATRERNIEETALKTNLEAAVEIARQLRLRDLAGLIVIDFIDMEDRRNNYTVEKKLREALKIDRARIQVGRISNFGLLEMSRQRLRPSLAETSMIVCPHCQGIGYIHSVESSTLQVLRALEGEASKTDNATITLSTHSSIAMYLLNQKRTHLTTIESKYNVAVVVDTNETLVDPPFSLNVKINRKVEEERDDDVEEAEEKVAVKPRERSDNRPERQERSEQGERSERGERNGRRRRRNRGGRRDRDDAPTLETISVEASPVQSTPTPPSEPMAVIEQPTPEYKATTAPIIITETPAIAGETNGHAKPAKASKPKTKVKPKPPAENVELVVDNPDQPKKGWWSRLVN